MSGAPHYDYTSPGQEKEPELTTRNMTVLLTSGLLSGRRPERALPGNGFTLRRRRASSFRLAAGRSCGLPLQLLPGFDPHT
jgi:hypothetical protein